MLIYLSKFLLKLTIFFVKLSFTCVLQNIWKTSYFKNIDKENGCQNCTPLTKLNAEPPRMILLEIFKDAFLSICLCMVVNIQSNFYRRNFLENFRKV